MKHVSNAEMDAAIEKERKRVAPTNALDIFRKVTGKKCPIRKNAYKRLVCAANVGWDKIDSIQQELKAQGIWTNSVDATIYLPECYWPCSLTGSSR